MTDKTNKFLTIVCDYLQIPIPKLTTDDTLFESKTTLAVTYVEDNEIVIRSSYATEIDLYFALAHELRHLWQYKHGKLTDRLKDKPTPENGIREYNLLWEELDANAFGFVAMEDLFGVRILFNGLDEDIKAKIYDMAKEIGNCPT